MNKGRRDRYWMLSTLNFKVPMTACLCQWCRYGFFSGGCCSSSLECEHPLEVVKDNADNVWQLDSDCWAFRPHIRLEDAIDVCGYYLRGEYVDWATVPVMKKGERCGV